MKYVLRRMAHAIVLLLLFVIPVFSQPPVNYYDPAANLTGDQLKAALHNIIKGHVKFPYTSSSTDVWDILKLSDRDPNNPQNIILFYTGWSVKAAVESAAWNREHVWAKSHGDFGETMGPGTDCHHLRPCDITVNSARGNKYFDYADTEYFDDGIPTGCKTSPDAWEPRDVEKGDAARMIFYMATRYEGEDGYPDLEIVDLIPTNSAAPQFGVLSTLLKWNALDPVDSFEMQRNNVVYSFQKNRNPFIDHPEYVNLIWGTPGEEVPNNYPLISNISFSPLNPGNTDQLSFKANASDSDGSIVSVKLHWGYNSEELNYYSTMNLSNSVYSVNLPAQSSGAVIYYSIEAVDDKSGKSTSQLQSLSIANSTPEVNILPEINAVNYSEPVEANPLQISADVTDSDGSVKTVMLYWGLNPNNLFHYAFMQFVDGNYQSTIAPQSAGTNIYFVVEAYDNSNDKIQSEIQHFTVASVSTAVPSVSSDLFFYPNPAVSSLSVSLKDNEYVVIYSSEGKLMIQSSERNINISKLEKGLYFIQLRNGKAEILKQAKMIKP